MRSRLTAGAALGEALAGTLAALAAERLEGRFNFLLTDGETVAATAAGDTLCYRAGPGRVLVASEPGDDEPGWVEVPDGSLLEATVAGVSVTPLGPWPAQPERNADAGGRDQPGRRRRTEVILMSGIRIERLLPDGFLADSLRADARAGLTATPKVLPPKWFYDERGSELFDKITLLDEYYPTRAERSILRAVAGEIAAQSRARTLAELGSGSADKTRLLLDALRAAGSLRSYVQVDVSEAALVAASPGLLASYPGLELHAVVSDFEEQLGPARGRLAEAGRVPRRHDRQPAAGAAGRVPGLGPVPAVRWRRAAARHRPGQGPGGAGRGVRRRRRGDRRVQQEHPVRAEHQPRRPVRPGCVRARGAVGPGPRMDRDAAPVRCTARRSRCPPWA